MLNLHPTIIIINLLVLGVGMTIHEFAHNYVGWKMGDPVPKMQGRLTLNPLVHINWIGWLMFAIVGFGILGSAPISPQRMRDPRWGYLAAVAAGPFSNLALAIIAGILFHVFGLMPHFLSIFDMFSGRMNPALIDTPMEFVAVFMYMMVRLNVLLFIFNLIPLFPIDGWWMVLTLLPATLLNRMQVPVVIQQNVRGLAEFFMYPAHKWKAWQTASYYVFIGLIFWSLAVGYMRIPLPDPLGIIISQPVSAITSMLIG